MILFEIKKILKSKILLCIFIFNVFGALIGAVIYGANKSVLSGGTQSFVLWGQMTFFTSQLFLPILFSIISSLSCQFEEKNKNWQRLISLPIQPHKLILSKIESLALVSLFSQLLLFLLFIISSFILQVDMIGLNQIICWSFTGWLASITITTLQVYFNIKFKNFSIPILLSAIFSIFGLMTLFVNQTLFTLFPYNQIVIGMRGRSLTMFNPTEILLFLLLNFLYISIFYFLSCKELKKRFH
ncbi:ABC transporter permease [Streptococcus parauberis]|uniref:ABC transporter permease n=1 Tax=Streptococcus parauberis TaxID=1348 RepID=UPI000E30331F|nr:ABC transporter permease [Streptococcus parauberis]RFE01456.1 ABC-2 family transporter protein [Streptococcus parauberis]